MANMPVPRMVLERLITELREEAVALAEGGLRSLALADCSERNAGWRRGLVSSYTA